MAESTAVTKEVLTAVVALALILGGLYAYAGTWPPAYVVESSSMMHSPSEVSYGRFGTIDPGDLLVVREVHGAEDVSTWAEREHRTYGDWGDVIVYRDENAPALVPIVHRAMAWVDVETRAGETTYTVDWSPDVPCPEGSDAKAGGAQCVFGEEGVTIPEIGLVGCTDACAHDGFITKGDNAVTNQAPDQTAGITSGPVRAEWVAGEVRGEVPWLGLIKLALAPEPNEIDPPESYVRVGNAWAPADLWVMLGISLLVLIGAPMGIDVARAMRGDDGDEPPGRTPGNGDS